jgi:hypothetical protein
MSPCLATRKVGRRRGSCRRYARREEADVGCVTWAYTLCGLSPDCGPCLTWWSVMIEAAVPACCGRLVGGVHAMLYSALEVHEGGGGGDVWRRTIESGFAVG